MSHNHNPQTSVALQIQTAGEWVTDCISHPIFISSEGQCIIVLVCNVLYQRLVMYVDVAAHRFVTLSGCAHTHVHTYARTHTQARTHTHAHTTKVTFSAAHNSGTVIQKLDMIHSPDHSANHSKRCRGQKLSNILLRFHQSIVASTEWCCCCCCSMAHMLKKPLTVQQTWMVVERVGWETCQHSWRIPSGLTIKLDKR